MREVENGDVITASEAKRMTQRVGEKRSSVARVNWAMCVISAMIRRAAANGRQGVEIHWPDFFVANSGAYTPGEEQAILDRLTQLGYRCAVYRAGFTVTWHLNEDQLQG